ncbi:MAG TPA: hypothetical protein VK896_04660 [Gaiellaceae bacterium]|nr:hypothetical protein [Gaiellaceae bacterium]
MAAESIPAPPSATSVFAPQSIVSAPSFPSMKSSFASPFSVSLPALPTSTPLPVPPFAVSPTLVARGRRFGERERSGEQGGDDREARRCAPCAGR